MHESSDIELGFRSPEINEYAKPWIIYPLKLEISQMINTMIKRICRTVGRRLRVGFALAAVIGIAATPSVWADEAAMLLPGSINDQSWNASGYAGLKKIEGLGYKVAYSENVQSADHVAAMRDYARRGFDIVIGHSGRFVSAAERVAPEFSDVQFIVGSGAKGVPPNMRSVEINRAHFSYALGVLAAKLSKSGKVGLVAGLEGLPTIVDFVGGLRLGVLATNPDAQIEVIYLANMEDAAAAKEAALSIIANGADIITGMLNAGHAGLVQAAKEKGVYAVGRSFGHTALAPKYVLTNTVDDWASVYEAAASEAKTGELFGDFKKFGFDTAPVTGATFGYTENVAFNPEIPKDILADVEAVIEQFTNGRLTVTPTREDARSGT